MYKVISYQVADSIDIKGLKAAFTGELGYGDADELFYTVSKERFVYIFKYGVVVDTSFTGDQFNCRFNFEMVDDGHYQVTLTSGKEKMTRNIEINTVTRRSLVVR